MKRHSNSWMQLHVFHCLFQQQKVLVLKLILHPRLIFEADALDELTLSRGISN